MPVSKVLHVIPSVGPLRGGPSTMVRNLASSLAQAGVETHVATTDDNGRGRLQVQCGVPVVQGGVTYWYFRRQTRFYTFSWPLSAWLSQHVSEFDVVHIHALFSFATLPAAYWANRRGVPYVIRPLGTLNAWGMKNRRPWVKNFSFRMLEGRVLKHAARVHYTSNQERFEAESLNVTTPAVVIPNPLSRCSTAPAFTGRFRTLHPELKRRRIVLFLSRVDKKKGLDMLLRAFAEVRREVPDAVLVIAGDGEEQFVGRLKADAKSLGLEPHLFWAGFLAGDEKQAALADAEVYVLPSYSENFGIAVAEAMAAGVPVIVSDQVGIHHDISEASAGLVIPCDVEQLKRSLVRLLGDRGLRLSMGQNGKRLAQQRYSLDAVTNQVISVYNKIAS